MRPSSDHTNPPTLLHLLQTMCSNGVQAYHFAVNMYYIIKEKRA